MQTNLLPKGVCDEVERIIHWFLCGNTKADKCGEPLVHRDNVKPLHLGFKNVHTQNEAFVMKLTYQMVSSRNKLWVRLLRAEYHWLDNLLVSLIAAMLFSVMKMDMLGMVRCPVECSMETWRWEFSAVLV
ncbi:hypothetical protein V6N13_097718 [Hibiscus sabdariffa]